jgi:hypothetical protein
MAIKKTKEHETLSVFRSKEHEPDLETQVKELADRVGRLERGQHPAKVAAPREEVKSDD